MNLRYLLVFPILALPHDTAADEGLVYESFSGVTIGRLFLSQSEREYLDVRRLLPLQEGSAGGTQRSDNATESKPLASAGYIVGRSGRSKIWKDGDFVNTGIVAMKSMSFPGDVRIERHGAGDESVDSEKKQSDKRNSAPEDDDD